MLARKVGQASLGQGAPPDAHEGPHDPRILDVDQTQTQTQTQIVLVREAAAVEQGLSDSDILCVQDGVVAAQERVLVGDVHDTRARHDAQDRLAWREPVSDHSLQVGPTRARPDGHAGMDLHRLLVTSSVSARDPVIAVAILGRDVLDLVQQDPAAHLEDDRRVPSHAVAVHDARTKVGLYERLGEQDHRASDRSRARREVLQVELAGPRAHLAVQGVCGHLVGVLQAVQDRALKGVPGCRQLLPRGLALRQEPL